MLIALSGCVKEEECIPPIAQNPYFEPISLAMGNFAQSLFLEILATRDENAVISPLSAYYVLTMVALGAEGDTLQEFHTVLGIHPQDLALKLSALSQDLARTRGSTTLNLAGSIWVSDYITINDDFYHAMIYYFDARAYIRNLQAQSTIDEVNAWISCHTQGLIENILDEVDDETIMLLINTLYLQARWERRFNPMGERLGYFYPEVGAPIQTTFLLSRIRHLYAVVTDYYEAVLLPYDDDRLQFFLIRPTDGAPIREFAAAHDLIYAFSKLERYIADVEVSMPMLDKEYEADMIPLLIAMGLELAFNQRLANLLGLVEENSTDRNVFISDAMQKVRIRVDAEGTAAAAATVAMPSLDGGGPLQLVFNTPYIYMILDNQTGAILFIGVVDNP